MNASPSIRAILIALAFLIGAGTISAQGSVLLVGGGGFPPEAMEWFANQSADGRVIILDYEHNLSARTVAALEATGVIVDYLPVPDSSAARDARTLTRIKRATAVFLPGGDQWKYVSRWRGTPLIEALRSVFGRGGVVGGTSAGAMILGEAVYDARNGGASSAEIEADPSGPDAAVTVGFLDLLPGALVDTHVTERDRVRRMVVFLNRAHAESGSWFAALGLDESTALAIGRDRVGTVYGNGDLSVLVRRASSGLDAAFELARLTAGQRLDLTNGSQPALVDSSARWTAYNAHRADSSLSPIAVPPPRATPVQTRRVGW